MYDEVFLEQKNAGIIEKIEDIESFKTSHPEHSSLPHMGIYKMNRDTTKLRVVHLSNLFERIPNQIIKEENKSINHYSVLQSRQDSCYT